MAAGDFAPFVLQTLDSSVDAVCGVSPELTIEYVNHAWTAFMTSNGAAPVETCGVGANLLAVTPSILRPFYQAIFRRATETAEPVEHDYECSSPDEFRVYRMRVHPCRSGAFVVVHSLIRSAQHTAEGCKPIEQLYRNDRNVIVQCSNCRRVRRVAETVEKAAWDWVPAFVARMPTMTSHGICSICSDFYYADLLYGPE